MASRRARRRRCPTKYYATAAQARVARSARLHPLRRSGRLPDRDQVREHPDQGGRHRRIARPRRSRSAASSIRPARTSFKAAQAFRPHVLDMFEPQDHPERLPVSRRPADSALRQRRLDARVPDGPEVRSHARRRSTAPTEQIPGRRSSRRRARSPRRAERGRLRRAATRSTTRSSPSTGC